MGLGMRRCRAGRLLVGALIGCAAWLSVGVAAGMANTSAFYYDGANNLAATYPFFGGNVPGGSDNTAVGQSSLNSLTSSTFSCCDTAVGALSLFKTTGGYNTGTGFEALENNSTGGANTANGALALAFNSNGGSNTATGVDAMEYNDHGSRNVANGAYALNVSDGSDNVAVGDAAMDANQTGGSDVATGSGALQDNTTGNNNVATGYDALTNATTGDSNVGLGSGALSNDTAGGSNIAVGMNAGANLTTGSGNIDVGNQGVKGEADVIRIGTPGVHSKAFMAGITGQKLSGAQAVVISSTGQLGVAPAPAARAKTALARSGQVAISRARLSHLLAHLAHLERKVRSQGQELHRLDRLKADQRRLDTEVAKLSAQLK
jgi:hypothetical protein